MKYTFLNKISFAVLIAVFAFGWSSCKLEEIPDPNGADVGSVSENATAGQLQNLVTGIESLLRKEVGYYYDVCSIIGREYYFFTGSDPRYTGELLGKEDSELDPAGFYGTRPYTGRYRTIKNCNILIDAANNTSVITAAEAKGYLGFAKTIQAYELLLAANLQYDNGIRLDVKDPNNLGAFTSDWQGSLAGVASLLDEAAADLDGAEFAFKLSSGFDFGADDNDTDFDTAAEFLKFNRGLAARVALYQGNKTDAIRHLGDSFYDAMGSFDFGPSRPYSTAGGETTNPLFRATNQSEAIIAHPQTAELLAADARGSKISQRNEALSLDGLSGAYDVVLFNSRSASVPLMVNEELILIAAEANIGTDNGVAEAAINVIRGAYGLDSVSGLSDDELLNEVIAQRRLSLFGLGHRWVDMRRFGRLGDLPIDRDGDDVWTQFPRPVSEN